MTTATVSSKGQIVIPKKIRDSHGWKAGVDLVVEDTPQGVLLRSPFDVPRTTIEDVIGCTGYRGPRKSIREMDEGVRRQARKRR